MTGTSTEISPIEAQMRAFKKTFIYAVSFMILLFFIIFIIDSQDLLNPNSCAALSKEEIRWLTDLTKTSIIVSEDDRQKLTLADLTVITFASANHISEAIRSCDTFMAHPQLKNSSLIAFLAADVSKEIEALYKEMCPVAKVQRLDLSIYPLYIQQFKQYRFKAIYQAVGMQNQKVVLNIDSSVRFNISADYEEMLSYAIENNPLDVTLLSPANHSTTFTTHHTMYNCFPNVNITELTPLMQYQSGIILWIASQRGWKTMSRFVQCALQLKCMAPPGSTKDCDYSKFNNVSTKFSGCHRFDQSAINLILHDESKNQGNTFQRDFEGFDVQRREMQACGGVCV